MRLLKDYLKRCLYTFFTTKILINTFLNEEIIFEQPHTFIAFEHKIFMFLYVTFIRFFITKEHFRRTY